MLICPIKCKCIKFCSGLLHTLLHPLHANRRWLWTPTWSEFAVRTTGMWSRRSRTPASRGCCGSTGELSAGSSPVRGEHGLTGRTASHVSVCCSFSVPFVNHIRLTFVCLMLDVRVQPEVKWKLSSAETYSKMRLKLVPNNDYHPQSEASAQRDNMGRRSA